MIEDREGDGMILRHTDGKWQWVQQLKFDPMPRQDVQMPPTRREADAYRAGMEAAAAKLDAMADATPIGHENRERGASTYNWLRAHAAIIRKLKDDTP